MHGAAPVAKAASLPAGLSPRHPADGRFGTPARRALQRGSVFSSRSGMTLTATSMLCPRPPRITPRSGTTSAKSAPQARVM